MIYVCSLYPLQLAVNCLLTPIVNTSLRNPSLITAANESLFMSVWMAQQTALSDRRSGGFLWQRQIYRELKENSRISRGPHCLVLDNGRMFWLKSSSRAFGILKGAWSSKKDRSLRCYPKLTPKKFGVSKIYFHLARMDYIDQKWQYRLLHCCKQFLNKKYHHFYKSIRQQKSILEWFLTGVIMPYKYNFYINIHLHTFYSVFC